MANFSQITHLFWPYSQNTIINSECKRLFCWVEGGDAHWRLYRLPVVTVRAEPQEGGEIARAWIEDPKVYPGIQMPQWWRWVPKGTVVASGGRFVKILGFLLLILAKLCWLTSWKVLAWRQGLVSFPQKNTPTNLRSYQIYIKMQKYCKFIIFIFYES